MKDVEKGGGGVKKISRNICISIEMHFNKNIEGNFFHFSFIDFCDIGYNVR